ncbi:uncharacterized protein KY384_006354 [Bacidia gigantensis]|uniref:uncharacterized protein n=1 Tax=Bacidia gigantensis TaxID=2732470 RepID=UPI001D05372B|nr:uncharacterized protein KY384_006354 [Bacidia gigantensis]KAG8528667.1 hypothetical protein KY384_006354 [Bacidia gigantensis]
MPQRRSHFPGASSSATPLKQKRALSPAASSTPGSRRSKRVKSSPVDPTTKITAKKSPYFEHPTSESESESVENEESGYEDEDASAASSPPESESEEEEGNEEYNSSEDEKPAKKPGRKIIVKGKTNGTVVTGKKGQELWRPGVKVDMEAGEAVFIPLPKPRSPGNTPYEEYTVHPNTLLFMGDLAKNNDREWLKMHDADYRQAKKDWDSFVESLTEKIIENDETIPELPPKDLTFRIYRDIRFSPDPTPYKTHFSAAWSRTGRKGPYAGYYVQIQPKGSFVGAGVWHPEAAPLALLRRNVDKKSRLLKEVLKEERMRKEFLKGAKKDDKEVVKKFVEINGESALKTKPRDYSADHPEIALLRLRNYTIGKKLKDEEVLGKDGLSRIADLLGVLTPFVTYLNSVVMPDEAPSSDDDDDDEDEANGVEEEDDNEDDENEE